MEANLNIYSRTIIQKVLENHGYVVHDSEPLEVLLQTVRIDINSGEIEEWELEATVALFRKKANPL